MAQLDASKAQWRAIRVLGIFLVHDDLSYQVAGNILQRAGAPGSGIPAGHDWRSAARLTDDELRRALKGLDNG